MHEARPAGQTHAQPLRVLELGTALLPRGIGLGLDRRADPRPRRGITCRSTAPGMGPRGDLARGAVSAQSRLHERQADSEQVGQRTLRASVLRIGVDDTFPYI